MNKFTFVVVIIFNCFVSKAQWTVSGHPIDFKFFSLVSYLNEQKVIGIEYKGVVYSDDGGKTFLRKSSNQYTTAGRLQFFTDTSIFMAQGRLRKSIDNGQNWQIQHLLDSNLDTLVTGSVLHFNMFNNGSGYVFSNLNNRYKLFTTHNLGSNWTEVDSFKINLPKYAMTANNALQILPEQSQIRIQSMLEKMIFEKNTRSAILNDSKEMLDFKDILENANYNKLERKLGKKNAMLLQNTIKEEISKLPKEKQAYLIKKLDIIKQTNWTLGIVAQLQLLFLSGYIFAFVKR